MTGKGKVSKPRRSVGRPSGEDGDLRERLLDAAVRRFASIGIAATSLRDLAIEAGVTPALLHYYFGDRARLVDAVIRERLLPVTAPLRSALADPLPEEPVQLAERFVRGIGAVIAAHPWLPALWVREVLNEDGALRSVLLDEVAGDLPARLARAFADAQAAGRLDPALDPRLLPVSLIGLTLFAAASAPIWRAAIPADDIGIDSLVRHAVALLGHGMQPPAAPAGGKRHVL